MFILAKPEAPIDLVVSTIYYNSIELEWKPGGMSDIAYYTVKYREDHVRKDQNDVYYYFYDEDSNDSSSNDIDENFSESSESNFVDAYDSDNYDHDRANNYENTTNTKYKIQARLKPFTYYNFEVSAVNLLGESKKSANIRVRTAATSKKKFKIIADIKLILLKFRTGICTKYSLHLSRKFNFYN